MTRHVFYDGKTRDVYLGKTYNWNTRQFEDVYLKLRRWGNVMAEAQPRFGKSVITKDICIKISKFRPVVIFDHSGEWKNNVTKPNKRSETPMVLSGFKLVEKFTFNIREFSNEGDFASMGFEGPQAQIVCDCINEGWKKHNYDLEKITRMLSELPEKNGAEVFYNRKWDTRLLSRIHSSTKASLLLWWKKIMSFFYQGPNDDRAIYDFEELLRKHDHLIINMKTGEDESQFINRTYAAKIIEQMWPELVNSKPVFFFEEARMLFPVWEGKVQLSSNHQAYNLVTHGPKLGVSCFFIVQHANQLYARLLENIHVRIMGRVASKGHGKIYQVPLEYNPELNIREFLLCDVDSSFNKIKYTKFRPCVPCMSFVSDR
jgi:hypothetical protein